MVAASNRGSLDEVVRFANSIDVEQSADALATTATAEKWLAENLDFRGRLTSVGLTQLRDLRQSLRTAMWCHCHGVPLPPAVFEQWSRLLRAADPSCEVGPEGISLESPSKRDASAVIVRLFAAIDHGLRSGSLSRAKLCHNDACAWGFLDSSRSRTGRWCSMGVCGNRAKQARWREGTRPADT